MALNETKQDILRVNKKIKRIFLYTLFTLILVRNIKL